MQELIQYKCEHCGCVYGNREKCAKCEASHAIPDHIASFIHHKGAHDSQYPHTVVIKFNNGASIVYKKG